MARDGFFRPLSQARQRVMPLVAPAAVHARDKQSGHVVKGCALWRRPRGTRVQALSEARPCGRCQFAGTRQRYVAGAPQPYLSRFAVPSVQKGPPAPAVRGDEQVQVSAIRVATNLRDLRQTTRAKSVDFPCHPVAPVLSRVLAATLDLRKQQRASADG
jgi:hypothetical protein